LAIFYILLINIIFFTVDLFNRKYSIDSNSLIYAFNRSIYTCIFAFIWLLIFFNEQYYSSTFDLLNISASALLCGFAFYLFIISNKYLKFTNILFIQLIGYVLHQLIGYIIFNESLSQYYILASFLLIVGILIQIAIPNQLKGLMVALLSTFLWTIGYSLMSIPLKNVSTPLSVFVLEITLLLMYYLLIFITKHKEQKIYLSEKNLPLFGVAFLTIFGSFLLNFTYKYYNMSQIGLLNLVIMPLFIFISLRVNKEKLSLKEIISNAIILLGYIMALL